jgi:hypothetical protein
MATPATIEIRGSYGSTENVETSNATTIPLLSADVATSTPATDYPVRIPLTGEPTNYSYERYLRFYVADIGTSYSIRNIKFYADTSEIITGSTLYNVVKTAYSAPLNTNGIGSAVADGSVVATTEATAIDVTIGGLTDSELKQLEFSDYLVLQVEMPDTAVNEGSSTNIYFVYDEVA